MSWFLPPRYPTPIPPDDAPGKGDSPVRLVREGGSITPPTVGAGETADVKFCPCCRAYFPLHDFGSNRAARDGRNVYCKPCQRDKQRANRDRLRAYKRAQRANQRSSAGARHA